MRYKGLSFCFALLALVLFISPAASAAETHQGKVLASGAGKLTIMDTESNTQLTQDVAANAAVLCESKKCGISDVKAGDMVMITVDENGDKAVITKIEVKKARSSS